GLHLVAHRLLRAGDDLRRATPGRNLLGRRLREVVRPDRQLFGQLAVAEDAHAVRGSLGETGLFEGLGVHRGAGLELRVEVADVGDVVGLIPRRVAESALGDAAEQRHLPALERPARVAGPGAGVLSLVAAGGGLAVPAADAAADAFLALAAVDALVDGT